MAQDRRLKPGKDIRPLKVHEFDMLHVHLRGQVALLEPEIRKTVGGDILKAPEKIDALIRETILKNTHCLQAVLDLSEQRPSVFNILTSCHKYDPAMVQIQRDNLRKVEQKELTSSTAYYETFKDTVPDSAQIIRDLQREATSKKSAGNLNLQ